ncbi:hypothetical protein CLAFUW4_03035 [Fulvia fulva]|uniref:Uncharacterized protein n=1 Tax=Passalora fulva TaxID=5499 RepID=A0A9Q8P4Q7_PASFU|nr:uncharacterized protein CLAFUR5_03019 [Fulvia fulva]KAK4631136.1 hypothetical protein CLAFUR4_03028 [Fulvia fulva]UJO13335.1 hypothetical protein CLAFUR5_03019 [Fulvia fulva]WPV10993.1 hypothetical protein CLAFUW4_03035 [Fulvia fulva]WPV26381.1 hypothetical protein CLAFUW7_03032 [Fulvia fulva]
MDRDRDSRRRADVPPEDQYGSGRGQSYRPGNVVRDRSPPRADTYRARSPPRRPDYHDTRADTYRARPRSRTPPPRRDEYRRRSPSPPRYRDAREAVPRGGDSYRGRPRSPPPRREDLPRDDLFRREPVRDDRGYRDTRDFRDERDGRFAAPIAERSPLPRYRERSAVPLKRTREPSPISSRGRRSPPPVKRERLASPPRAGRYDDYPPSRAVSPPRRRYSPDPRDRRPSPPRGVTRDYRPARSRSPMARNDRVDPRAVDDWRRPRSPVRDTRHDYLNREESVVNSTATSRRSSPPVHPSRAALNPAFEDRPRSSRASPRDPYNDREPYRAGDPEPRRNTYNAVPAYDDEPSYSAPVHDAVPPPREPRRSDDAPLPIRAPPTGPSSQRATSMSMAPPTGPAASGAAPSGPRAAGAPPAGPRGSAAPRGDFAPRGRGGFGSDFAPRGRGGFRGGFDGGFRGGRGGAPTGPSAGFGRGDAGFARSTSESFSQDPAFVSRPPPSGPRGSFSQAQAPSPVFSRQSSMSTSTPVAPTGPRGQRFANGDTPMPDAPTGPKAARRPTEPNIPTGPAASRIHPALLDLPKIVEGGIKAEPLIDRTKLTRLENEAERLREQIDEKEQKKRKSLREWDRLQRESEVASLRSELAEQALRELNGEAESQAAF